jgi:hypothetical protein
MARLRKENKSTGLSFLKGFSGNQLHFGKSSIIDAPQKPIDENEILKCIILMAQVMQTEAAAVYTWYCGSQFIIFF